MPNYKLVIFDWDGTLSDSTDRIVDSMQQAARINQMPAVTDAQVQNIIGLGLPEAIKALWPEVNDEQLAAMIPVYARYFVSDSVVPMQLFDGAVDLLKELMLRGVLAAVATGKARRGLDRMLLEFNVGHLFAATRCADETRSKPHPQMLHEILASLGVTPEEALMVGDTTYDLEMANAAGVPSIGMSHGAHDEARLLACRPLAICHSMHELKQWIINHG